MAFESYSKLQCKAQKLDKKQQHRPQNFCTLIGQKTPSETIIKPINNFSCSISMFIGRLLMSFKHISTLIF